MYRNRRFNRNANAVANKTKAEKRPLNVIDEDASIKLAHKSSRSTSIGDNSKEREMEIDRNLEDMFSEENIPASQEPTQRYLSQRSTTAATLMRTQSKNLSQRPPNTFFELVLMKAGVQLDDKENFILTCDHVAFVGKFRDILLKSPNYPENVETFKCGVQEALGAKSRFAQKLLTGCTISVPGGDEGSVYQSQDSMMANFLMIDFLAKPILDVLLDKIEEAATSSTVTRLNNLNIPVLPLLLTQLRYVLSSHGDLIYERIKAIFEKSSQTAKWDIIASAEFILDTSKHNDFAQLILETMAESKDFFNSTVINTMTNLCLGARIQERIRHRVLAYIKETNCSNELLPVLIRFLFKILHDDNADEGMRELVKTLRDILNWKTSHSPDAAEKQIQKEIFNHITQALTRSHKFYVSWQKTISSLPSGTFSAIDFVVLLLLMHIKEDNSMYIENILRRRIKLEDINLGILNEAKQRYSIILEQYTAILMEVLHDFLREKNKAVADFARASYSILFQICDSIQKSILKKLMELTCDRSATNMTNLSLELLRDLQRKYPNDVQNWGMLLMPLLDRLSEMSLAQTRCVMELLCSVAYPAPNLTEVPALQEQIDMLVKKQIINCCPTVKKQGIISAVQLIDSIARIEETVINKDDFDATYTSVEELPEGRGKVAAAYIERIQAATMHCPESLALFFDELASVCAASPYDRANQGCLDKPYLMWLCELITYYFQNSFIIEGEPQPISGIELSNQRCINSPEDVNSEPSELPDISVNIAELVLKPKAEALNSVTILAPLFNLARVLHLQRYEGSLESINALLGCAIVLPTFFDNANTDAIFYNYDEGMQKKILDIYFHCVNWIRETVCSFATQRESMIRRKVLQRLADVIQIEETVQLLLEKAPADYMPPVCNFISSTRATTTKTEAGSGRGRPAGASASVNATTHNQKGGRKKSKNQTQNDTLISANEMSENATMMLTDITKLAGAGKHSKNRRNFDSLYGPKEIYRQLDSELMLLLREELIIVYPLPEKEVGEKIGLLEFRYIMNDLVAKLESITGAHKLTIEQNLQYIAKPQCFMNDLSKFFKNILHNMATLSKVINEQLDKVRHVYTNADLIAEEFSYLKICYGLCVQLFSCYFSWHEFADSSRSDLLKQSFLALMESKKADKCKRDTMPLLAKEIFDDMIKCESSVLELKTAVHLYHLMVQLRKFSMSPGSAENKVTRHQAKEIRTLCKTLLSRKWINYAGSLEKGALCNVYLDQLVKGFLKNSNFCRQNDILTIVLQECKSLNGKGTSMKSFPNITKANFPLLFRGLCEILITSLQDVLNTLNTAACSDKLQVWEDSCELLNMLLDIVRVLDMPRIFALHLKYSHIYLKLVLQHGIPVLEQYLRHNPERVSILLKTMQVTTRYLHNLCCHSKASKDTAIVTQVPFLRETVENLVFRVKALLAANKVESVFWMGNLKNEDLHGDAILSQPATLSSTAESNSDEEIPEDDISLDETVMDESAVRPTTSSSSAKSLSKCF